MRRSTARGLPVLLTAATGLSLITAINALAVPANDADAVINSLQASGYRVTVTRIGSDTRTTVSCSPSISSRPYPMWPARAICATDRHRFPCPPRSLTSRWRAER